MKQIKLIKLTLENFKKFSHFEIDFDGLNATIIGENESGKSTIADAYYWLTTGKNFNGDTKFTATPTDEKGFEMRGCITSVTAIFEIDGARAELKKEQFENVTKKEAELLTANSIAPKKCGFYIDNVPLATESAFKSFISTKIGDDETIKLLTNINYFIGQKPEKQRETLTKAVPEIDLKALKGYTAVEKLIANVSLEQKIAANKSLAKTLDKELDGISAEIKENGRNFVAQKDYESDKNSLKNTLNEIDNSIAELNNNKELLSIQQEIDTLKADNSVSKLREEESTLKASESETSRRYYMLEQSKEDIVTKGKALNEGIKSLETRQPNLICPTCKRAYDNAEQAKIAFDKKISEEKAELLTQKADLKVKYDSIVKELPEIGILLAAKQNKITNISKQIADKTSEINSKILGLTEKKNNLVFEKKENLLNQKSEIALQLQEIERGLKSKARETELINLQTEKTALKGVVLCETDLLDNLLNERNASLETAVNSLFDGLRFKLFEKQTNGEIKAICEPTYKGIKYADLNTAKKTNAGLEIINMFSKQFGIYMPIFVDNTESVNKVFGFENTQIIKLKVVAPEIKEVEEPLIDGETGKQKINEQGELMFVTKYETIHKPLEIIKEN